MFADRPFIHSFGQAAAYPVLLPVYLAQYVSREPWPPVTIILAAHDDPVSTIADITRVVHIQDRFCARVSITFIFPIQMLRTASDSRLKSSLLVRMTT